MGWVGTPGDMKLACENQIYKQFRRQTCLLFEGDGPTIVRTTEGYELPAFIGNGDQVADLTCISTKPAEFAIEAGQGYTIEDIEAVLASGARPSSALEDEAAALRPPLKVNSWRCETDGDYVRFIGEVENQSSGPLENVAAYAVMSDDKGILAKEESLIDFKLLRSGESSPFEVLVDTGGRSGNCQLTFGVLFGEPIDAQFPE